MKVVLFINRDGYIREAIITYFLILDLLDLMVKYVNNNNTTFFFHFL